MNYYIVPGLKFKEQTKGMADLKKIAELVCDYFALHEEDFYGKVRKREFVEARSYFMWIAKKSFHYTLADIGRVLGKDHTTVIHGLRTLEDLMFSQERISDEMKELKMYVNKRL
jgi:chromosomal replication initiator protein